MTRKRIELIALLLATTFALAGMHLYNVLFVPPSRDGDGVVRVVEIPKGTSFRVVATNLEKAGVVKDSDDFLFAASLFGAYKSIKAGEYELTNNMTPLEVLDLLVKGVVKKYAVTIPEGYDIEDIAARLAAEGLADRDEFISRAEDEAFVKANGLSGESFEGYLFPDTYVLTKGMTVDEIILAMVDRFKTVYSSEFEDAARRKGMGMTKVVTLASIIEKETGDPSERKLISAVFHNRLKKGIRLQSDPTVIYAIKDFDGNLTRRHLLTRTPYNTYRNYGLPPGPIANPGRASIDAAINPAHNNYLYFVSRNDGTHYFSKSLREHNRAVYKFQKSN